MEIIGYFCCLLVGLALGLLGSGGSILTVPILVYFFQIPPSISTAYSLVIVGTTALVGSVSYYRRQLININAAILFSIPSIIGVFISRKFLIPALPELIIKTESVLLSKDQFIMIVFSLLMLLVSYTMLKKKKSVSNGVTFTRKYNNPLIFIEGFIIGMLTGFLGAGGGFMIIPALVLLAGIPMKEAVGTSLIIIAIKSLVGFTGDLSAGVQLDYFLLSTATLVTTSGIFIGSYFSKKAKTELLKHAFGWFVLVMGAFIIIKELKFSSH